jgi:hemerythrin-like domain-containing protein
MTTTLMSRSRSFISRLRRRTAGRPLLGLAVLLLAGGGNPAASGSASAQDESGSQVRPTEAFRVHHAEIEKHLRNVDAMVVALRWQSPEEQRETMRHAVTFLQEHIASHAHDEEHVLYPAVQRRAGQGSQLTVVPVYEHRIVERWIAELDQEASKSAPDPAAFALTANHLTGLLYGHFEVEEEVLLSVLDETMTAEEFQREIADQMPH